MRFGTTGQPAHPDPEAGALSGTPLPVSYFAGIWKTIRAKTTIFLPLLFILALAGGMITGAVSQRLSDIVNSSAEKFVDWYSVGAPALIFIVLAPVLSRILSTRRRGKFGVYVIGWLAATKVLALLWAVLFTVVVFRLPIISENSTSVSSALAQTSRSVLNTLVISHFFWAIYAAVATGLIATKSKPLAEILEKGVTSIEYLGQYIQPLIPAFMFAVGVYVQSPPDSLERQIGLDGALTRFETLNVLGFHLDPNTTAGMVTTYVVGSLLVAVACFAWHFAILGMAKVRSDRFSIKDYFKNYWVKMHPLLWSTSSETLATPLNLYILAEHNPWVRPTVRRIVIGAGSVLCTNGTLICVIILTGLVGGILGLQFSLMELLLVIPVAFLISFGIPGIPGELLLFAGPIALVLDIPPELNGLFLALYLGLQIGLPDSFRTGGNTTNNYVYAILLNETYEKRFLPAEEAQPAGAVP